MKLIIPKDCGNAPRKQIVLDFMIDLLTGQDKQINEYAHDEIRFHQLKDHQVFMGRESLKTIYPNEWNGGIESLAVELLITHGKFASINGLITLIDGSKINFCDVYTFSSAAKTGKVKEIKSYQL